MRLYLDTNILTYFLYNRDELSEDSVPVFRPAIGEVVPLDGRE